MAGKDKGGRASKTPASKTAKEKRQAKKDKKAAKGNIPTCWGRRSVRDTREKTPTEGCLRTSDGGPSLEVQTVRTLRASGPLRPGPTSNSTV